jgi:hypothetical protein
VYNSQVYFFHCEDEWNDDDDCWGDSPGHDDAVNNDDVMVVNPSIPCTRTETILPYVIRESNDESDEDLPRGLDSGESSNGDRTTGMFIFFKGA